MGRVKEKWNYRIGYQGGGALVTQLCFIQRWVITGFQLLDAVVEGAG
jgi:hypothetical protein